MIYCNCLQWLDLDCWFSVSRKASLGWHDWRLINTFARGNNWEGDSELRGKLCRVIKCISDNQTCWTSCIQPLLLWVKQTMTQSWRVFGLGWIHSRLTLHTEGKLGMKSRLMSKHKSVVIGGTKSGKKWTKARLHSPVKSTLHIFCD